MGNNHRKISNIIIGIIALISAIAGIIYILIYDPSSSVLKILIYYFWVIVTILIFYFFIVPYSKKGNLNLKAFNLIALILTGLLILFVVFFA